jgi:hypothetical protein
MENCFESLQGDKLSDRRQKETTNNIAEKHITVSTKRNMTDATI